jgi:hypothetical protein
MSFVLFLLSPLGPPPRGVWGREIQKFRRKTEGKTLKNKIRFSFSII